MKRLIITKLIVISQSESRSLEVPFSEGLNIIYGGNKTGKSSIIKSIFTAFGCECKRVEKDWKNLISSYLLFFKYGHELFCIVRQGRKFQIFVKNNDDYSCITETQVFHEYSNCLMDLFGVNMPCVSNKGESFNITPPLLFRFQYIDQDEGWSKIADSFDKIGYIKDWKKNTNKYVCGYLSDKYYMLQAKKIKLTMDKEEKKKELNYNQGFVSRISTTITQFENAKSIEEITSRIEELLAQSEELRKKLFAIKAQMAVFENDIYINQHKLNMVHLSIEETEKDIEFAMTQESELICPTCGAKYTNGITEQLNISSDYAHCEKLRDTLTNNITILSENLQEHKNEFILISEQLYSIEQSIQQSQELLSYSSFYKNKGQYEIYESCIQQLEIIQTGLNNLISQIANLDEEINSLKSNKRSQQIKKGIEGYCSILADTINIPKTFIKLRDFVQVIDRTGSETPRLVYMYQSALYLYNLSRMNSPFNFFVIDTPNQQGQDHTNLQSIFNSLELFLSHDGQVILGTERETGMENKATLVTTLNEKRRCLNDTKYNEHVELLETLQKKAARWVALNHNKKANNNI